jgi:outer membrane protein assembly factor BamB
MRARTTSAFLFITLSLIAGLAVPVAGDRSRGGDATSSAAAAADVWPGWRGLTADGRTPSPLPTDWGMEQGFLWKVPIPGQGHSSPIVFGNQVYVTSAYMTSGNAVLQTALRLLTLGLVLAVAGLALRVVVHRCHPGRSPSLTDLASGIAAIAAVLALAVIGYGSDGVFDFARCNIRGWIAATGFASLCLALTATASGGARLRWAVAVGAVAFAVFVLAAFPSKGFAFRGGLASLRMQISVAVAAVPFALGAGVACMASRKRTPSRRAVLGGMAVALVVGGLLLVRHLLVFRDDSFPATPYVPHVSGWLLMVAAAVAVFAGTFRLARGASLPANVTLVVSVAAAIVLGSVMALEWLATRSPYLAYQLGAPAIEPQSGDIAFWMGGAALVVHGMWLVWRASREPLAPLHPRLSAALAVAAVAAGAVFFAHVNYVQPQRHMVRAIVAFERDSGGRLWVLEGLDGPQPPIDGRNSPATPTPVTDGRYVCAYFGTPGMMCADASGRLAWSRTDLGYDGFYGVGFSPVLADGTLVIAVDAPSGEARIHALDIATGESRWTRAFPTTPTVTGNNRTPIVREIDGEKLVILWGMQYVRALSLGTGEPVWHYELISDGDLVSSAISDDERLYLSSKAGTVALDYASLAAGREPLQWTSTARANCVSPVLANGILFTVTDAGIAVAIRPETGETLWRQRLPGHYFASLVASRDAVYFTNSDGLTTVVAAAPAFRMIAQNDLAEPTMASMAAARGVLFARAGDSLFAIGTHPQQTAGR